MKPGEKVQLRYRRDNKVATATVTAQTPDRLFAMPPMALRGKFATAAVPAFPMGPLGAIRAVGVFGSTELVPLTPKLGQYFGTEKGLLVVRAPVDSRLKLEDGDVIVDIDGRTPSNPAHAFRILGSYQAGEKLTLNVLRQKKKMSFDITVPDEPAAGAHRALHLPPAAGRAGGWAARGHHDRTRAGWAGSPMPPPPPGPGGPERGVIAIGGRAGLASPQQPSMEPRSASVPAFARFERRRHLLLAYRARPMRRTDFAYDLPVDLIAQHPPQRPGGRAATARGDPLFRTCVLPTFPAC